MANPTPTPMKNATRSKGHHDDFASDRPEHVERQGRKPGLGWEISDETRAQIEAIEENARTAPSRLAASFPPETGPDTSRPDNQGWRPIESAPRDGLIDLWADGRRFMDCYWDHICAEYRTTGSAGVLQRLPHATHWRPVPAPPESEHEQS